MSKKFCPIFTLGAMIAMKPLDSTEKTQKATLCIEDKCTVWVMDRHTSKNYPYEVTYFGRCGLINRR